jgi:hypothetical protein
LCAFAAIISDVTRPNAYGKRKQEPGTSVIPASLTPLFLRVSSARLRTKERNMCPFALVVLLLALAPSSLAEDGRPELGSKLVPYTVSHAGYGTWSAKKVTSGGVVPLVPETDAFLLLDVEGERLFTDLVHTKQWTFNNGSYTHNNGECFFTEGWTYDFQKDVSLGYVLNSAHLPNKMEMYSGAYVDYPAGIMAYEGIFDRDNRIKGFEWQQAWRNVRNPDGSCPQNWDQFHGIVELGTTVSLESLPLPVDFYFQLPGACLQENLRSWTEVFCWNTAAHA